MRSRCTERGLVFMDSPGFDPCSATGQVASGATMIAFTTGRGSAYGCKPSPSIKLSSNSEIYRRMEDDIDIDCGPIATGEATIEQKGEEILDYLLEVASGRKSKSEAARLWRRRVRALAGRRGDVGQRSASAQRTRRFPLHTVHPIAARE